MRRGILKPLLPLAGLAERNHDARNRAAEGRMIWSSVAVSGTGLTFPAEPGMTRSRATGAASWPRRSVRGRSQSLIESAAHVQRILVFHPFAVLAEENVAAGSRFLQHRLEVAIERAR